jgi:hypothetical protein
VAAQGLGGERVGPGRAAKSQIDPAGNNAARVPNCSAMISGAWLGSMTPPAPMRMVDVPAPTKARATEVAALAMPCILWCSAIQ